MTRNILSRWVIVTLVLVTSNILGCYVEMDMGLRTPRRDPCTGVVATQAVYVSPACRLSSVPPNSKEPDKRDPWR